jgi:hypothetical protein
MKIGRICESAPKPGTDLLKACPKQTHWADPNKVIEECARLKGHPFTDVCNLDFCLALTERLECNQADAENSSEIAAGLFHRSRELEERQRIESNSRGIGGNVSNARGIGGNVSSAEDSNANAEVPLVLNRRAAQRSVAPPPVTPQLTASAPSHSYRASPCASDLRDNASAGESGVAFSASYRRGEMKSQSAKHSGSDSSTLEFDTRNRQGRGAHIELDESTPVISASAFKGYTNGTEALPPGWELKIDQPSGRKFYVNHQQKSISWDRPRVSHGNDSTQRTSRYCLFCSLE